MGMNIQDDIMEDIENLIYQAEKKKRNTESDETKELEHAKKVIEQLIEKVTERDNYLKIKNVVGEMLFTGLETTILRSTNMQNMQNTEKTTAEKEKLLDFPPEKNKRLYDLEKTIKSTNLINRDINAKFDAILEKLDIIADAMQKAAEKNMPLTTMDRQILEFVKEKNSICADDVQKKFGYKGKNAASMRLNNLHKKGLLKKKLINKKVYYQL